MIYDIIVYILFSFLILRFLVVIINTVSKITIPNNLPLTGQPLVSILIPARNEEKNIKVILDDLLQQQYKNIEIIVYDDDSEDNTAIILETYSKKDKRIKWIKGNELPESWLGKNYGCHNLALQSTGTYLLFVDSDIRVSNDIITNSIAYLQQKKLVLLSIFPKQEMGSIGEKLTVPIMNWILLSLLPVFLIKNCSWKSFSAANGQFMLFEANQYKKHYWHKIVKNEKVEDIKIQKLMKKEKYKVHTLLGHKNIRCRMYENYKDGINGFSKNVPAFFGNSFLFMFFFTLSSQLGIFIVYFYRDLRFFPVYLIIGLLVHLLTSLKSKQNILSNLVYLIPRQISFGLITALSIYYKLAKKGLWKGRPIS